MMRSTRSGSFRDSGYMPKRPQMRMQCVSATVPPLPYRSPSSRLATLRPTPGRRSSSSMLSGTRPPYSSVSMAQAARMSRAFIRYRPQGRTSASSSAGSAAASAPGVGQRANRSRHTRFTRASVHWAESRAITISRQGSPPHSSAQGAWG